MATHLRIAMLNTDTPVPNVYSKRGTYGDIFSRLLQEAASETYKDIRLEAENFDVVLGNYPSDIATFNAVLVTGSAASSYDTADWIQQLDVYIKQLYDDHPNIKIFGSCFGHQIVCQSLLRTSGAIVEKAPNGWELGVKAIHLENRFMDHVTRMFSNNVESASATNNDLRIRKVLRLQFVHADHVRVAIADLPVDWMNIGNTEHCKIQGVFQPGRVLTYQGHFEFDRFINSETLKIFGASWEPQQLSNALEAIDADDDSELAAELVLRFLAGFDAPPSSVKITSGLVTPPEDHN